MVYRMDLWWLDRNQNRDKLIINLMKSKKKQIQNVSLSSTTLQRSKGFLVEINWILFFDDPNCDRWDRMEIDKKNNHMEIFSEYRIWNKQLQWEEKMTTTFWKWIAFSPFKRIYWMVCFDLDLSFSLEKRWKSIIS